MLALLRVTNAQFEGSRCKRKPDYLIIHHASLTNNVLHHLPRDIGESVAAAEVFIG